MHNPTNLAPSSFYSRRQFLQGAAVGTLGVLTACSTATEFGQKSNTAPTDLKAFIQAMPKAELHVHIEGTVDPTMAIKIAERNGSTIPYANAEAFEAALDLSTLESFLKGFHDTIAVLRTEEDFYDITYQYLEKCRDQNIIYADIKFDPQAHMRRGIDFETFFNGMNQAQQEASNKLGVNSQLIMCYQRDASIETAETAYAKALNHRNQIVGIGLDNTEIMNFPAKFAKLFAQARQDGFKLTSHCDLGQPNTVEHIRACIEDLKVDRLDHGYNILEDERLVQIAREKQLCFTACPTTAFNTPDPSTDYYFAEVSRSVKAMLEKNLKVTMNTDDPGVMGNRYLSEVIFDSAQYLDLTREQVVTLSRNAFESLWVPADQRQSYLNQLANYVELA